MHSKGLMTALVTPLKDDHVDRPALERLIDRQIEAGVSGLVPCGTTGEAATLSSQERDEVIACCVERVEGRIPILVGVGTNDTRSTVVNAKRAEALGADGVLVVTPPYNKPTQEGLFRHFASVAEAVTIDLCLYNVPGRTGISLLPDTVARLAEIPNITAIKEASGSMKTASEILLRTTKISLLSGDDFTVLPFMALGGEGAVSVVSNIVPALMRELVDAAATGDLAHARDVHFKLYPLMRVLFIESNPIPVKSALAMMGLIEEAFRLPLHPLSLTHRDAMRRVLGALRLTREEA